MKGRTPKPAALVQRRNKVSTRATLPSEQASESNVVPDLPEREPDWHPMVRGWWVSVWRSPMAAQMTQLRLYAADFGLSPASQNRVRPAGNAGAENPFAKLAREFPNPPRRGRKDSA